MDQVTIASTFLVGLALFATGCGPAPQPKFAGVMGPGAGVGTIVVNWTNPRKTTWVCNASDQIKVSIIDASSDSSESSKVEGLLNVKVQDYVRANAKYENVKQVTVKLSGGKIEHASMQDALPKDISAGCKNAIEQQRKIKKNVSFDLITKLYRGDVKTSVVLKNETSGDAKLKIEADLEAELKAGSSEDSSTTSEAKGAVWIVESEPYFPPT